MSLRRHELGDVLVMGYIEQLHPSFFLMYQYRVFLSLRLCRVDLNWHSAGTSSNIDTNWSSENRFEKEFDSVQDVFELQVCL